MFTTEPSRRSAKDKNFCGPNIFNVNIDCLRNCVKNGTPVLGKQDEKFQVFQIIITSGIKFILIQTH